MKVYLDTSVYRFISDRGEVEEVRRWTRARGVEVVSSAENLFETYAIPDPRLRLRELSAIARIASCFERYPASYRQAKEIRLALMRHRREWIQGIRFTGSMDRFVKNHRQHWLNARSGVLPPAEGDSLYRADAEAGTEQSQQAQKEMRVTRLARLQATISRRVGDTLLLLKTDLDDHHTFWRLESLIVYDAALLQKHPSSRDLADWLLPFLNTAAIDFGAFVTFWQSDLRDEEVPLNRLAASVSYFQLGSKVTHGNTVDQLHACQALGVDGRITADRPFYDALVACRSIGVLGNADVRLVDRATPSALAEIEGGLFQSTSAI